MITNDILRRLRYTFKYNDNKMIVIFGMGGLKVTRAEISDWLKKHDDEAFIHITDTELASFLNGMITDMRGKKEGSLPVPEKHLTNNIVLRKLKIALNLQADDMLDILSSVDLPLSKHELSAFFRKAEHKHHRQCKDQVLRNFLKGVQYKFRGHDSEDVFEEQPEAEELQVAEEPQEEIETQSNAEQAEDQDNGHSDAGFSWNK